MSVEKIEVKAATAYGLCLNIQPEAARAIQDGIWADADKVIEVLVKVGDIEKQYTIEGFFSRLGFSLAELDKVFQRKGVGDDSRS